MEFCLLKSFFFHQLNNQYVVVLNILYFYPSQPRFQKLNMALPWLRSVGTDTFLFFSEVVKSLDVFYWLLCPGFTVPFTIL